jgi:hypothetical protein
LAPSPLPLHLPSHRQGRDIEERLRKKEERCGDKQGEGLEQNITTAKKHGPLPVYFLYT